MKKIYAPLAFIFSLSCILIACNMATPEKYFDIAVLNSNMVHGFAGRGMQREMEQPTARMDAERKPEPFKRKEELDQKIKFLDENFTKLKALKKTEDAKEILQASLALYEYIMPVYKIEYKELANLYDNGASQPAIDEALKFIQEKYYSQFDTLMQTLRTAGKAYASKHNIVVNWRD